MEVVRKAERPRESGKIGDYEILEEVRDGAQSLVFRAKHPGRGRVVGLKRLAAGAFSSDDELRRGEVRYGAFRVVEGNGCPRTVEDGSPFRRTVEIGMRLSRFTEARIVGGRDRSTCRELPGDESRRS